MKAVMYEWIGGIKNLPAWFKHQEEAEVSWEQIKELYDTGNNVMLAYLQLSDVGMIIFVDNKRFSQR